METVGLYLSQSDRPIRTRKRRTTRESVPNVASLARLTRIQAQSSKKIVASDISTRLPVKRGRIDRQQQTIHFLAFDDM